jgi:hypothetical protein
MAVVLTVRSKVKDYDVWRPVFDSGADFVAEQGVISSRVLRDPDDPSVVIVHHEFADPSAARAFRQLHSSDAFREGPVEQGGVLPETIEVWIGEDV